MAQPIKIQGSGKNLGDGKKKPLVSQSIPAHWYKTYNPPTPKLKPKSDPLSKLPNFELPPSSPDYEGITKLPQFSMSKDKYPMSLPVHRLMGPKFQKVKVTTNATPEDQEEDAEALRQNMQNLQVGSFTCMQLMTGGAKFPNKQPTFSKSHSEVKETSKEEDVAQQEETNDDDGMFDMESDEEGNESDDN